MPKGISKNSLETSRKLREIHKKLGTIPPSWISINYILTWTTMCRYGSI